MSPAAASGKPADATLAADVEGGGGGAGGVGEKKTRRRGKEQLVEDETAKMALPKGWGKRMCNRTTRKLFLFLIVIVALIIGIPNFLKVQARSGAVQAKCRLTSFHYPEDYVFPPDSSMPCPKDCGFQVMGFMESRPFEIRDWEPKFDAATSLPSRGWGSHEEFSCCPLEPFDHCLFYQAGSFCDDFGKVVDGCPKAAWDCYIIDLEKHLAGTEGIPPGDLYVGKAAEGQLEFMAALAMLGFAVVCLVFPKTVSIVARFIVKQSGERADLLFHQLPVLVAQGGRLLVTQGSAA
mmetsp:Transcript_9594/g.34052  ORF Transcript_9594/g.34052 Transcript_9594/m.34052 type:complete len:293 (-) Transcript_9594:536-1414(-)